MNSVTANKKPDQATMNRLSLVSAFCTLSFILVLFQIAVSQHGGEEMGSEVVAAPKTLSPCAIPLEDLYHAIEEIFETNYTVYINCLSFDKTGSLNKGVASGNSPTGPDRRYVVECRGDILVALESLNIVDTIDIRTMTHASCINCVDVATPMDTCVARKLTLNLYVLFCIYCTRLTYRLNAVHTF